MQVTKEILNHIAGSMEAHEKCFINKKTLEVVTIPDDFMFYGDLDPAIWNEELGKIEADKGNFVEIGKMNSQRAFETIEMFVDSLPNSSAKRKLLQSIDGPKPFARFKHLIENAGPERELWFKFRRQKNIEWIEEQLLLI